MFLSKIKKYCFAFFFAFYAIWLKSVNKLLFYKTLHIWRHVKQKWHVVCQHADHVPNADFDKEQHATIQKSLRQPVQKLLLKHDVYGVIDLDFWPISMIFFNNLAISAYLRIEFCSHRRPFNEVILCYWAADTHIHTQPDRQTPALQ